jgi:hypothetical protein
MQAFNVQPMTDYGGCFLQKGILHVIRRRIHLMQIVSEQKGNRLEKYSEEGINIVIQFFLSKNQPGSVGK